MTADVLVRGGVEILKGVNAISLEDIILMIENAQMKVTAVVIFRRKT